jgi:hypothetical protein
MQDWKSHIDLAHPCFDGYRVAIRRLPDNGFPGPGALTRLLPPGQAHAGGNPVRFRPAADLPGVAYEEHIYQTGEVSTREDNWHDLFNALVWCRFPQFKSAMNEVHYRHLDEESDGRRGSQRDALTLLDESGVIVIGNDERLFSALAGRNWNEAFVQCREAWAATGVIVCGHAILEKFLHPYKALTAHALLLPTVDAMCLADLDGELASGLLEGSLLQSPRDLSPLPLMGIPGWWAGAQDEAFYADSDVFRPPRPD